MFKKKKMTKKEFEEIEVLERKKKTLEDNKKCIDCGHEFNIHQLTNGMCSMCIEFENDENEDFTFSDYEEYLKQEHGL